MFGEVRGKAGAGQQKESLFSFLFNPSINLYLFDTYLFSRSWVYHTQLLALCRFIFTSYIGINDFFIVYCIFCYFSLKFFLENPGGIQSC